MAPTTNFDRSLQERQTLITQLEFFEMVITEHSTIPIIMEEVERLLQRVQQLEESIWLNHNAVNLSAPKDSDMTPHADLYHTMLRRAIKAHATLKSIFSQFSLPDTISAPPQQFQHSIKLPRLELPKFDGSLQDWFSFRDMFQTAVHNSSLTKVEKLTQLKSLLTGEASRHVKSLLLTENNYDIAWETLCQRYENNRELFFTLMKKIFYQSAVQTASATSIRLLIDGTKESLRQLEALSLPTEHWDAVILFVLHTKVDNLTRELWEQSLPDSKIPHLEKFLDFLEQRARALAANTQVSSRPPRVVQTHHAQTNWRCKAGCDTSHPLFRCIKFRDYTIQQRLDLVKSHNLCHNCLFSGHSSDACRCETRCKVCNGNHHTMIHTHGEASASNSTSVSTNFNSPSGVKSAPLATALVKIYDNNIETYARAFIDPGSHVSFITQSLARRMKLLLFPCNTEVTGLADNPVGSSTYTTSFVLKPHFPSTTSYTVKALVVSKISSRIHHETLRSSELDHIKNLQLADPEFHKPGKVDILLGSEIFWDALLDEKHEGKSGQPIATKTKLGWLVAGSTQPSSTVTTFITTAKLDMRLQKFWESESIPEEPLLTPEEIKCETHFANTHKRNETGRFIVAIPWKKIPLEIGSSKQHAYSRLLSLERRLFYHYGITDQHKLNQLQTQWDSYCQFMKEYEDLGHMSQVPPLPFTSSPSESYYIPHHFVVKESSTTTKLRVVFDASARTTNGQSLNGCMMVGPKLQDNIFDIMLRFRLHSVAFTADLEKMYRQILVREEDRDFQRILWRDNPSQPVREYTLNTVTYGTASAPYLAVRALQQLGKDEAERYPEASAILLSDFYVDDLQSGTSSLASAKKVVTDLIKLSMSAGFPLRKWTSNCAELLDSIPMEFRETKELIPINSSTETIPSVKTLGVFWNPSTDKYHFKLNLPSNMQGRYTKNAILSEISMIYDPLGWLSPAIVACKIFMQQLWKSNIQWNVKVPKEIEEEWIQLKSSLKDLENVSIPRCIISSEYSKIILCGFSDASMKAMAAAVYICTFSNNHPQSSHLLVAKTKVAPVNAETLPRLELNSAVLLSKLVLKVSTALKRPIHEIHLFSDSTITLHWINSNPSRWKTYVRNRVQTIQTNVPSAIWHHISGTSNPVDCASRGITASELLDHPLWWKGNIDAIRSPSCTPEMTDDESKHLQKEESSKSIATFTTIVGNSFLSQFSSFLRQTRITAWIFRFTRNSSARRISTPIQLGPLTTEELKTARLRLILILQQESFSTEITDLLASKEISKKSNLVSLSPFLDADGLLRVGGRIRQSHLSYNRKHPLLLPRSHPMTTSIITDIHVHQFHAGATSTLSSLNLNYWIVRGRDEVRRIINKCVICTRHKATTMKQIMGDLPASRINPSQPFTTVGVDYAGPFSTRSPGRSKITFKSWLAIFVCFSTRAIHLEVVSSLSTDTFLAALRRFMGRRGKPKHIYSDCGTNFVGASKVLAELFHYFQNTQVHHHIHNLCANDDIQWHFNPPSGPHFGGLWEAGVRSVKYHLNRVIGNATLTYKEMLTLMIQIEAILNSRPIIPASSDPADFQALTPGHFLIGTPLNAPPEENLMGQKPGRLDRWKLL